MPFMVLPIGRFRKQLLINIKKGRVIPGLFLSAALVAAQTERLVSEVFDKSNTKLSGSISVDSFYAHAAFGNILLSISTLNCMGVMYPLIANIIQEYRGLPGVIAHTYTEISHAI